MKPLEPLLKNCHYDWGSEISNSQASSLCLSHPPFRSLCHHQRPHLESTLLSRRLVPFHLNRVYSGSLKFWCKYFFHLPKLSPQIIILLFYTIYVSCEYMGYMLSKISFQQKSLYTAYRYVLLYPQFWWQSICVINTYDLYICILHA